MIEMYPLTVLEVKSLKFKYQQVSASSGGSRGKTLVPPASGIGQHSLAYHITQGSAAVFAWPSLLFSLSVSYIDTYHWLYGHQVNPE